MGLIVENALTLLTLCEDWRFWCSMDFWSFSQFMKKILTSPNLGVLLKLMAWIEGLLIWLLYQVRNMLKEVVLEVLYQFLLFGMNLKILWIPNSRVWLSGLDAGIEFWMCNWSNWYELWMKWSTTGCADDRL